jgi:hypothetical protein
LRLQIWVWWPGLWATCSDCFDDCCFLWVVWCRETLSSQGPNYVWGQQNKGISLSSAASEHSEAEGRKPSVMYLKFSKKWGSFQNWKGPGHLTDVPSADGRDQQLTHVYYASEGMSNNKGRTSKMHYMVGGWCVMQF